MKVHVGARVCERVRDVTCTYMSTVAGKSRETTHAYRVPHANVHKHQHTKHRLNAHVKRTRRTPKHMYKGGLHPRAAHVTPTLSTRFMHATRTTQERHACTKHGHHGPRTCTHATRTCMLCNVCLQHTCSACVEYARYGAGHVPDKHVQHTDNTRVPTRVT